MSIEKLKNALDKSGVEYRSDVPLAPLSTFKIGGRCAVAVFPKMSEELVSAVRLAREYGVKYDVIGKASNLLFSDGGYDGMLLFVSHLNQIEHGNGIICAEAGAHLGTLSSYAAAHSLSGLEFAYGIPGSLGGAIFMNAGAYGGEMKDVVAYSDYYDPIADSFGRFSGKEQKFSYRKSIYSENKHLIILGGAIKLNDGYEGDIRALMNENMQKRRDKQPLEYPSAGSAFKRPENGFAAQMIDECGLKGLSVGGAQVSEKHAGFIINKGGASSADVKSLMNEVADRVFEKFGVRLESEIRYID